MRWLVLLVGCTSTTWRTIEPDQIDHERVLVVTDKDAYEMTARHTAKGVEGHPLHAWTASACALEAIDASPVEIAEECGWLPAPAPRNVRIDDDAIVDARAERTQLSKTSIVVGVLLGIAAGALVYEGVLAYSLRNTH